MGKVAKWKKLKIARNSKNLQKRQKWVKHQKSVELT